MDLSPDQLQVVQAPLDARIFLEGPASCGKTTAGVERLLSLMESGVPGSSILLLVPQRTLAAPYQRALLTPGAVAGGQVDIVTMGGLARRMIELFWPLVAGQAGFAWPDQPPAFLTLETAQYYIAHLVRPLLEEGYFDTVTIDRNRLYSQIIDNLNKAAVVGFPYTEIGARLQAAWGGDPGQARIYQDAQACAERFRQYCLAHNLLDFSLQMEIFRQQLWGTPACREYLESTYRHLIADNIEEDTPVAHDLLLEWLPRFDSALLIYDQGAGYRRFLGTDPESAYRLKDLCSQPVIFERSFVTSPAVTILSEELADALHRAPGQPIPAGTETSFQEALSYDTQRFFPQMLDWVAAQIAYLVNEDGLPPGEIAVLAPFMSDALRFALANRLTELGIPSRSHRPSRSLREEPAARCLLAFASLAHPEWELPLAKYDLAYALISAIAGMDLVRAQLLVDIVYRPLPGALPLSSFDMIKPEVQERITYRLGERYERLRLWLEEYHQGPPVELDHFLSRLFGEVLSQPGYGFHADFSAGEVAANLVESIQKFRWAVGRTLQEEGVPLGREYLLVVQDGIIAAQYIRSWQLQEGELASSGGAVLMAPAYTFLMSNRPVEVQFWLDIGSQAWFERLYQPLTHPYVLSRAWPASRQWNAADEHAAAQASLERLVLGLLRRCRRRVYLGWSELNEQGFEQRGELLVAIQRLLRRAAPTPDI